MFSDLYNCNILLLFIGRQCQRDIERVSQDTSAGVCVGELLQIKHSHPSRQGMDRIN